MKRIFMPLLAAVLSASSASAEVWTLDSCITYALDHNLRIRSAEIERLQGEYSVTEAKNAFLPTLNASASQNWDFGRGLTSSNTYANRNTSMFSWGAQMSLPLFQGLRNIRQLRYSKSNLTALEMQTEAARDEVRLSVITDYLQVLYNKELLEVSREQLRMSRVQLNHQKVLLEGGKVPEVDVIQANAKVAQSEVQVVNSENEYQTSIINLAKDLELDDISGFEIAPIDDLPTELASAEEVYNNALANYPALRATRQSIKAADDAAAVASSGYLPRLNFNAGLG
ncbi:MAG: TolC family protein, partial [Duncaniella sp.]|nr:TolC family protein [Duncaniella sp.]